MSVVPTNDGKSAAIPSISTYKNLFNISDKTIGCIMLLLAAFLASIDAIFLDVAEDDGVSANAMTLYSCICTFIGSVGVDIYFWYVGYGDGCHVCLFLRIYCYCMSCIHTYHSIQVSLSAFGVCKTH